MALKATKATPEVKAPKAPKAPKALPAEPVAAPAAPAAYDVVVKGEHGFVEGACNGKPFRFPRGERISIPARIYHILKEAGELA